MTICIAALYGNRKGAVLASDRMVTARIPMGYEFEHQEITKIVPLNDEATIFALTAGDVLLGTEILNAARGAIKQQQQPVTVHVAAEVVRAVYQQARFAFIVQRELEPRGLTRETYYSNHQSFSPMVL